MRTEVVIWFWGHRIPGGAAAILGPAHVGPDAVVIREETVQGIHHVSVTVTLAEDDERLPKVRGLLKQYGAKGLEQVEDRYSDQELENARLLLLRPNYTCEVNGGSEFGTTYDLTGACLVCGAGARQASALFLDGADDELPKLKGHRAGYTYGQEVFVDDRVAMALDELAPTGLVFHQVYALMPDKRQAKLPWKQLSADYSLPPMSTRTTGISRNQPCTVCPRSGYTTRGKEPNRIVYRAKDLEGARDINLTWEGNGVGKLDGDPREWFLPVPWLLVTPKVMRVIRSAGVTEFDWIPIRVVDE